MCWGGQGLAASCLTSSSPMPRLDPVTRTLRASAAISTPGGDTRQDCRLLGVEEELGTAQGVALGAHGDGDAASTSPGPSPALGRARVPGWTEGSSGIWDRVSSALPSSPPLDSSKAPAPRVPITDREGSIPTTSLERHLETPPGKENRSKSSCGRRSSGLGGEFGTVEPRDADLKPSLRSAGRACLTLQAQLMPTLLPRSQLR